MKKNAEEISKMISRIILMCNDFSLNTAKTYLQRALAETNKVHTKREKREKAEFNWKKEQEEKIKKMRDKKTNPDLGEEIT